MVGNTTDKALMEFLTEDRFCELSNDNLKIQNNKVLIQQINFHLYILNN